MRRDTLSLIDAYRWWQKDATMPPNAPKRLPTALSSASAASFRASNSESAAAAPTPT